jgi:hypothetical protein
VRAPIYFVQAFKRQRVGPDPPLGICVYSDDEPKEGIALKLEVFLPDGTSVNCTAEVAWVERLPDDAPAKCDIGLRLVAINPRDRERLSSVLDQGH